MKLVKHPYVVQLLEVMASKTKIYIVLEYVTGGELFDKIVSTFCSNLALNHPAFVSFSWPCTVAS
jgi:serine/threonine protein kinase